MSVARGKQPDLGGDVRMGPENIGHVTGLEPERAVWIGVDLVIPANGHDRQAVGFTQGAFFQRHAIKHGAGFNGQSADIESGEMF